MNINNPISYFKQMVINETSFPMESLIRIEGLTNDSSKIHLFGRNSHRCLQINEEGTELTLVKEAATPYTLIYARGTRDNKFFTVKQGSNDLEVIDLELKKKLAEYKGYPEDPYGR